VLTCLSFLVRIQGGLNNFFFTVFKHIIRSVIELRFLADGNVSRTYSDLQISALAYFDQCEIIRAKRLWLKRSVPVRSVRLPRVGSKVHWLSTTQRCRL
jgi:hypothetical protein